MKRRPKNWAANVKRFFPLHWTVCDRCEYEHRMETMWKGKNEEGKTIKLCKKCANGKFRAEAIISTWGKIIQRDPCERHIAKLGKPIS